MNYIVTTYHKNGERYAFTSETDMHTVGKDINVNTVLYNYLTKKLRDITPVISWSCIPADGFPYRI